MFTLSAFADEIGPDIKQQMDVCESHGIKCIDVRSIDGNNVSVFTPAMAKEYKKQMDDRGFTVPCIGSPIGKIRLDEDFGTHLDLLKHCCHIAKEFGAPLVRIFSFYPAEGTKIADQRAEVMERLQAMVEVAEETNIVLMHENEKQIYGSKPDAVKDIFTTVKSESLKSIFDPANFVEEGIAPYDDAWCKGLAELTDYLHVKDKDLEADACVPAGEGNGQCKEIFLDLKKRGWVGYAAIEPHLCFASKYTGFSGPELFGKAVNGLKSLCDRLGIEYR